MNPFRRGLKKSDIDDLSQSIPARDTIAEQQGKPVYHGAIEEVENAMYPWLRARRRRAAARSPSGVRRP